ncbi:ankyrin repeat domain-containing protein [Paenibacillus vietnamensis]|uniref:ankyrin repeat domain-containing protein n=1 Tax=Paenibacillus vietnamensis TaxID=2590547 RepID=UPI0037C55A0E
MVNELIAAAERGDTDKVIALLQAGADINGTDERGRTAAMAATHGNRPETVKALIDAGADINLRDRRSDNPLLYAGAEGMLDIVKLAVEAGADTKLTNRFGGTSLIPAADRGHADIVDYLLKHSDVSVDHVNNLGWTALLEAVILGDGGSRHTRIVHLLVEHGADVNLADNDGVTPLAHAEKRGYAEIAAILKRAGANSSL